ncbi:MAG: prolipoprotein diacylglyceryl transferase [Nitrospirae bacterium]|nr:prolipoprotein diacylglyceryl transferase [Nitrospirota bacterium]
MHPVLFKIGSFTIYTFGVMLSLGFILGSSLAARGIREIKGDVQRFWDLCFWIFIAGIVGSRLHYVIINAGDFWDACFYPEKVGLVNSSCFEALYVWKGGLAFYGGFIVAFLTSIAYMKRHKINAWAWSDIIAPCVFLGLGIGRLGCFSAADDFGKPTDLPWALKFPNLVGYPDLENVPIHPTQLYMLMKDVLVFMVGYVWLRKRKTFDGQGTFVCLGLYSVLRFVVEFFRGDYKRGFIFEADLFQLYADGIEQFPHYGPEILSNAQLISIILFVISLGMLAYLARSSRAARTKA